MSKSSKESKKRDNKQDNGSPGWMATYGDMMTLLLCFFVLLYSMSVIDVDRFSMIIATLQAKLGVLDGGRSINRQDFLQGTRRQDFFEQLELAQREFEQLHDEIVIFLEEEGIRGEVEVSFSPEGLVIRFLGRVLFDLGRAEIKEDALNILERLSDFLRVITNEVSIEGHTDNWPITTTEFPSNWELSTARATTVLRYFIEEQGLDPIRFFASGYGEYRPIKPNDNPENRAINRRVEIIIRRDPLYDWWEQEEG